VKMLDTPCGKCGHRFPGFHICVLDFSTKEGLKAATTVDYTPPAGRKSRARPGANRSESVAAARRREPGRAERDKEIARLYGDEQLSINAIVKKLGYSQKTVSAVVRKAVEDGHIIYRGNTGRPKADAA
jgi:hypothetical protein